MSNYTHAICEGCWERVHPERQPYRMNERCNEVCCVCGVITLSGIYIRLTEKLRYCGRSHVDNT